MNKKQYDKEWRKKNKQKQKAIENRYRLNNSENIKARAVAKKLKHLYGISQDQYDQMLFNQNYSCKICSAPSSSFKKRLHVDHCHVTNKVRGLLCSNCNRALGLFKDSINILNSAIDYLKDNK